MVPDEAIEIVGLTTKEGAADKGGIVVNDWIVGVEQDGVSKTCIYKFYHFPI